MSNDALRFTVENGNITAVYEFDDGQWKFDGPDHGETWTWSTGGVTKREFDDGVWKTSTYLDSDGDGLFFKSAETADAYDFGNGADTAVGVQTASDYGNSSDDDHSVGHAADDDGHETYQGDNVGLTSGATFSGAEKYRFDIQDGRVVLAYENEHGTWRSESNDPGTSYQIEGADVLKIEAKHYGQEVTRYADSDGDGLYVKLHEQWVGAVSNAETPQITSALSHVHSDGDDMIAVRGNAAAVGGAGADQFVIREGAHLEVSDFAANHHDRIIFDTGLGLQSFEQLLSFVTRTEYDGQKLVVSFGEHASLTLVGVNPASLSAGDFEVLS
jgi:hypothetical protein